MTWNNTNKVNEPKEDWGGLWTEKKLNAFSKYVKSYLTIMNHNPYWKTIYFDGFAGSGSRKEQKNELFNQLNLTDEENSYKGAAERVLSIEKLGFDFYYFIDKDTKALQKLEEKLTNKYPNKKLVFRPGDANLQIEELAKALHTKKYTALIFLDPFGMQINWNSIKKLKETRSDLWILVPTGVIVNRLLDKAGQLKFSDKLEYFFGLSIDEIRKHFYYKQKVQNLFGNEEEIITKVSEPIEKIARLYIQQMKTIWKYVTENPLVLTNKKGVPIFHFVFASNNKSAVKIANQIIQKV